MSSEDPESGNGSPPSAVLVELAHVAWTYSTAGLAVVFAVQRLATAIFYSRFDVSPHEVGIGYLDGLVESVIVYLGAVVAVTIAVLVVVAISVLRQWTKVRGALRRWGRAAMADRGKSLLFVVRRVAIVGTFVGAVVLAIAGMWVWAVLALVPFVVLVEAYVENPFAAQPETLTSDPIDEESAQRMKWVVMGVSGLVSIMFFVISPIYQAVRDANAARDGREVAGFPASAWRAQPVAISWLVSPPPGGITEHCVIYLGQANDVTVMFDVDDGVTLRVPSSSVVIRTSDGVAENC